MSNDFNRESGAGRYLLTIYIVCLGMGPVSGCTHSLEFGQESELLAVDQKGESYFVHTVSMRGETLALIAKHYTGSIANWQQLLSATPWIENEEIFIGQMVLIPSSLVTKNTLLEVPKVTKKEESKRVRVRAEYPSINIALSDAPKPPGLDPEKVFLRQQLYEELVAELNGEGENE